MWACLSENEQQIVNMTVSPWFYVRAALAGVKVSSWLAASRSDVLSLPHIFSLYRVYIGLARTLYIRCVYGIFGREITKYTVIYGVYTRFWPTLGIYHTPYASGASSLYASGVGLARTVYIRIYTLCIW